MYCEALSPTALFRFDCGATPVVFSNSAFWSSMAFAASGNMDLMVCGSRPEFRLAPPGDAGGFPPNPNDARYPSTFNLFMASFILDDIGSFSPNAAGDRTPDIGWLLAICCST